MKKNKRVPKVLMIGPGRDVMGGISTVVNSYYELGLDKKVELRYISTMKDGNKLKKLVIALKSYIEFIKCVKDYDIVQVHMAAQASYTRKSVFIKKAKQAGKKIIIHQHSADFDEFFFKQSDDKKRKQIKNIFAMADTVIVLSEEWAEFFGNNICDSSKIMILYNGVIIPLYYKEDYSDKNVLFLGRLGKRKGSYDLLKVIPSVLEKVPSAHFYLGGDGDIDYSQKIINENGLQEHVKLLGWVRNEEKEVYLKKCSTLVLPSYHEGMPMSVLESMAYGLAVISTNAGGIPQIIEQGINGYRIEAGCLNELERALVYVLNNEKAKKELGRSARKRIEDKFNAERNIDRLYELYQKINV